MQTRRISGNEENGETNEKCATNRKSVKKNVMSCHVLFYLRERDFLALLRMVFVIVYIIMCSICS